MLLQITRQQMILGVPHATMDMTTEMFIERNLDVSNTPHNLVLQSGEWSCRTGVFTQRYNPIPRRLGKEG